MAGAVSWFLQRFPDQLQKLTQLPKVAEELRAARALAEQSEVLKEALRKNYDIHV